jgi:sulfate transport system permease protein
MIAKLSLRIAALSYLVLLLVLPVSVVLWRTLEHGLHPIWTFLTDANTLHALKLTVEVSVIAVVINTILGLLIAIVIVRHHFPGKTLLNAVIDLPLGVSPVVAGLALIIVYGRTGLWGSWLINHGVQIIFAMPGIVLATIFVSLPFVVREVVPLLHELGTEQEQAAITLGASALQTFYRITLPSIRPALTYGVVLTTARALGEFGAVSVVSGNLEGQTQTLTLYVQDRFEAFDTTGAYTASLMLALLAVLTLIAMSLVKRRERI